MIEFQINSIGKFFRRERRIQDFTDCFINFNLGNLEYMRYIIQDEKEVIHFKRNPGPYLHIGVPNSSSIFSFNEDRLNWFISLKTAALRIHNHSLTVATGSGLLSVPWLIMLNQTEVQLLEQDFQYIHEQFYQATPASIFKAECKVLGIIQYFMKEIKDTGPAGKLKIAIDADTAFQKNLNELSVDCGYNRDYLRICFSNQYGITPKEYQQRRRLNTVLCLLRESDLSISDIASRVGFSHVSNLSNLIRHEYGVSPGALRKNR